MVDHFSTYIYQKRGFYYFSRRVPKDVQPLHGKQRIVLALNTRSRAKALKYSQVICQRLDERWLPMSLDTPGFGNVMANEVDFDWPFLRQAILDAHKPIQDMFFKGHGNYLQYIDSVMAEDIMLKFVKSRFVPVLPVHDSFIVH